jgi:hypothetical protein
MTLQSVFQRDSLLFTDPNAIQSTLGEIHVLEIIEVLEDGLSDIEGLGTAGAPSEFFEALFDGLRKPDGQHGNLAIQV